MFKWFESKLDPFPQELPSQPPAGFFAFCWHFTKGSQYYLLTLALVMALVAITEVWLFGFLGNIVDWLSEQDRTTFLSQEYIKLIGMGLIVLVGLPILVWFQSLITHQTLLGNYPMRIRWLVHKYLIKQSMSYYQDEFPGRVATKLMQTALAVRQVVMSLINVINYTAVYFLAMFVLIGQADLRLTLPLLVWILVYAALLSYFVPRLGQIAKEQADARSTMTGRIVDSYTNIQTVKLFAHGDKETQYARESMAHFLQPVYLQMRLVTQLYGSLYIINCLLLFSSAALAIGLWVEEAVSLGAIAVVVSLVLRLFGMSQMIMWQLTQLFEAIGTVQDGINSIAVSRTVEDKPNAPALQVEQGQIDFQNVGFHYEQASQTKDIHHSSVIQQLNLCIQAGEKVGIVGRSGAGKSTLVNLLLRFYDVQEGAILIDGQNIADVQQDTLRKQIGMVTQDTSLLHRSVRDNILYGRSDASDKEVIAAATQAHAHDFIVELQDAKGRTGYDSHVGERGVKLSGGQRQRIAIARVLLKDAPILILDEATSALDSEVESTIQEHLTELMQDKTVIAIAHRLSTIAAMDRLIVMDKGQIIEQGTHQELIDLNGLYAKLWHRQSGGFIDTDSQDE